MRGRMDAQALRNLGTIAALLYCFCGGAVAMSHAQIPDLGQRTDTSWTIPLGLGYSFPLSLGQAIPASLDASASRIFVSRQQLPEQIFQPLEPLAAREVGLEDLFSSLAERYDLSLTIGPMVNQPVTIRLADLSVLDAIILLCEEYGLELSQTKSVLHIRRPEQEILNDFPDLTRLRAKEPVLLKGTTDLFDRENLARSRRNDILPQRPQSQPDGATHSPPDRFGSPQPEREAPRQDSIVVAPEPYVSSDVPGVEIRDGLVSLDVEGANVMDILQELTKRLNLAIVTQYNGEATVTASWKDLTLEQTLSVLLKGTNMTYRREGEVVIVADRQMAGMINSRTIRLKHIPVDGILERMPDHFRQYASFKVIRELNGVVITGSADAVNDAEQFLKEIDAKTPQILIEVLVVDFETSGLKERGVTFLGGLVPPEANLPVEEPGWMSYLFGGGSGQTGGLDILGDGETANGFLNFWSDLIGIKSIGRLPSDFYFRLQALERSGNAQVRSRPHVATLNGHTANITVGTSQYYILKSTSPVQVDGLISHGQSEYFDRVDADVRLEITPWVTSSGSITAVIRPSFATPVGTLDPRTPPTINVWSVDTSVRLEDGETFMIGGLIQERKRQMQNRIPILGSIPLLGRLFRNSRTEKLESELVIFISPHVFYGDETDRAKMDTLQERLGSSAVKD